MDDANLENDQSTVCLDGNEVKRLRETQKLTQLYVSKVIGVTTDTVSRWENNRYPTIRRENALKLAEALEVSLETILRKPEVTVDGPQAPPRRIMPYALLGIGLVIVITMAITLHVKTEPPPPANITAQRILPKYAAPGATIPIMVELTHRAEGGGFILREYFPKGWKLVQSFPPASSLDNVNGVSRWIIKTGDDRDRVVYLVQVDSAANPELKETFRGEVIAGGERSQSAVSTLGDTSMKIAPVHWADSNGDGRIDDVEMLQASYTLEDMAGVHIDWNHLERLWDAGSYKWDARKHDFIPVSRKADTPPR